MLVEIDDAGTGSLVGGIVIGARRGQKYSFRTIGVEFFNDLEKYRRLKEFVSDAVLELLGELGFRRDHDEILICQGEIFSATTKLIDNMGLKYSVGSIDSPLQDYVETAFDLHLTTLGIPRELLKKLRDYRDYTLELIKWVLVRKSERERFVKKLYPVWEKKWSKANLFVEETVLHKNKYCINCGGWIRKNESVYKVTIKASTSKYSTYSHVECFE